MVFYASISALINGIINTILCIFVFSRNKKDIRYRTYSLFSLTVALWSYCYFAWQISLDENVALFFCRGLMAFAIFIPVCYVHHLVALFDIYDRRRKKIIEYGYLGGVFFLILNFTPLFVKSVTPKLVFKFWPNPGIVFHPFIILWIGYVLYGVSIIISQYFISAGSKKNQVRYVLLATLIGWSGGVTNYPLWYDIPLLPFGNILVSGYTIITTYAIFKYYLMDIRVFTVRGLIFGIVYTLVLGAPFYLGYITKSWFPSTVLAVLLASFGPFVYQYLRKRAEDLLLKDQRRYQRVLNRLSRTMTLVKDLERLLKLIVYRVARAVKVEFACVYLAETAEGTFILKDPYTTAGFFPELPKEIPSQSPLIFWINKKRKPFFAEELDYEARKQFKLKDGLIIPSFVRGRLLGFLLLGPKSTGLIYTPDDAFIFEVLANQTALAIENTEFIEESQRTQAQLFAAERMTSMGAMAGGLSHQINNRLYTITLATSDTLDTLKHLNLNKASPKELKETLVQAKHALERIEENARNGGKIVNDFLNFSQPERMQRENKSFDLKEPLERAIEMVKIKTNLTEDSLKREIQSNLPQVKGDFVLLQDVFFNLIDNAFDALKEKEKFIAKDKLSLIESYKGIIRISISKTTDKILTIQIQDNGIGIKEEAQKKLFSPFFTTKATTAKGTGMGLFVIQKIISVHQGHISLTSEYKQGTVFRIDLPAGQERVKKDVFQ